MGVVVAAAAVETGKKSGMHPGAAAGQTMTLEDGTGSGNAEVERLAVAEARSRLQRGICRWRKSKQSGPNAVFASGPMMSLLRMPQLRRRRKKSQQGRLESVAATGTVA